MYKNSKIKIMMEDVDFSDLRLPVGRPAEDPMEERKDLTKYILERKFSRRWDKFFKEWERFIINRANSKGKPKYIEYMEEFYGEVLAKFEELSDTKQRIVSTSEYPIKQLYEFTNLSEPNLFHDLEDNEEFLDILKKEKL
jgi:hypothetical protein